MGEVRYPRWSGSYSLRQTGVVERRRLVTREQVPVYEFRCVEGDPLTLWEAEGVWWQPFWRFDAFDFGSVPLMLQGLVSPLAAPQAFALHDSCYEFHGVWGVDGLMDVRRSEADRLLRVGMRAEGCSWWMANKVWLAVRVGGGGVWKVGWDTEENKARNLRAWNAELSRRDGLVDVWSGNDE